MSEVEKTLSSKETPISPIDSNTISIDDQDLTLWQAVRKWKKVVLYCLALSFAVILYGYDQAIVGSVSGIPAFQNDFGQLIAGKMLLPSGWLGGWNLGTPLGVMVGGVAGGWFQDRSGRRLSLAVGSSIAAVGIAIMFCCFVSDSVDSRRGLFLGGKLVQGLGIGMLMSTTQTYMPEVLLPILRGPVLSFLTLFALLGQLIGVAVVYKASNMAGERSYTTCFAYAAVVAWLVVPEMKGRDFVSIDKMFLEGVSARDFEKWVETGDANRRLHA